MKTSSDAATLHQWLEEWSRRRSDAYRRLLANYTPEQKALVAEMTEAQRQGKLCRERIRFPDGATGKRNSQVAYPTNPESAL